MDESKNILINLKLSIILGSAMIFLLFSCEAEIGFKTPQPEGIIEQHVIPRKYHGRYLSLEDSSILIITRGNIVSYYSTIFRGPLSELDSADYELFTKDTIFIDEYGRASIKAQIRGDSVFYRYENRETVFSFARNDVLKKYKGYYFINHEVDSAHWDVAKIGFVKDGLVLGTLKSQDDLQKLRELTNQKSDSVSSFRLTKRQMKKFIRDKGFHNEERFLRLTNKAK
jgi:hypothetical protein